MRGDRVDAACPRRTVWARVPPEVPPIEANSPGGAPGICHPGQLMRRLLPFVAAIALVAVVVIGLSQAGGKNGGQAAKAPPFDLQASLRTLAKDPKPPAALGRLHEQANTLLGGGTPAFQARLRALRGHPVVVNKWASWCSPCRAEFPVFQQVATSHG